MTKLYPESCDSFEVRLGVMTKLYPESCDSFEVPVTVTVYGSVRLLRDTV